MNFKILFCILISILVVSLIFTFSMEAYLQIYDPSWFGIINLNKNFEQDNETIFILGASNVYSIDADYLNKKLEDYDKNFTVYNLADMGDNPSRRMNSIDNLIEKKPSIVIYGLGFIDIEKFQKRTENIGPTAFIFTPNEFFKNNFENILERQLNEYFPISPKEKTISLANYIIRGPVTHYHPFITWKPTAITDFDTLNELSKDVKPINELEMDDNDRKIKSLNNIIKKFQSHDIKFILFTSPYSKFVFDKTNDDEIIKFENMLKNKQEEFDINVYFLHDKYSNLEIWRDGLHIAIHPDAKIFSDDILEIILQEVDE